MNGKKTDGGGFILIVEDDRGANNLEAIQLKPLGFEIRSAYNAKETVEALKKETPRLMLLDYSLPDMSALELLGELEKNKIRVPPFLVLTGFGDEKLAVKFMQAGAQDYMVKDSTLLDNLLDRAEKALAGAALRAELEEAKYAAEEERDKFKLFIDMANDAVFVHRVGPKAEPGKFVEVNNAACERLGYTKEELLELGPADIDAEGTAEERSKAVDALVKDGRTIFETFHKAKDGRRIPVEISSRLFSYKNERFVMSLARETSSRQPR